MFSRVRSDLLQGRISDNYLETRRWILQNGKHLILPDLDFLIEPIESGFKEVIDALLKLLGFRLSGKSI